MTDALMGRNEYARHRGCQPNAVKKAEDSGRIARAVIRDDAGTFVGIKWKLADELWAANTDPDESLRNGKTPGMIPPPPAGEASSESVIAGGEQLELADQPDKDEAPATAPRPGEDPYGYLTARADRERHQAKIAELNLLERMGELVSAAAVREVEFDIYRQHRDKLEQIPAGISEKLAAETDPQRIEHVLRSEIRKTLNELSRALAIDDAAGGVTERTAATA